MDKQKLNDIHKRFFALRNGILADSIKKAGCPCPRIFGLNVPQLSEISRDIRTECENSVDASGLEKTAETLWAEKDCRESRLLATYLFNPAMISKETCLSLVADIQSIEEADMLAFRLFKRLPDASELLHALESDEDADELRRYAAQILRRHLS